MAEYPTFLLFFFLVFCIGCASYAMDRNVDFILEALASSGYSSMALTLRLAPDSLFPNTSGTIFAPSDSAFQFSGQISLRLLRYHVSPMNLPPADLLSLPTGTHIPTLLPERYLVITENSTINSVKIDSYSPIYQNSWFTVYGIGQFFNPAFPACLPVSARRQSVLRRPIEVIASRGFGIFASLLDMQVLAFHDHQGSPAGLTVLAVPDKALPETSATNLTDLAGVLRRHVLPCRVTWADIEGFGGVYSSLDEHVAVNLTRTGVNMMTNGAKIIYPDMYCGDSVVVHGLGGAFPVDFSLANDQTSGFDVDGEDL